jgi:hypothetical protein
MLEESQYARNHQTKECRAKVPNDIHTGMEALANRNKFLHSSDDIYNGEYRHDHVAKPIDGIHEPTRKYVHASGRR